MAYLIDRAAYRAKILEKSRESSGSSLYDQAILVGLSAAAKILDSMPTVEAEPVVRCKNCRHSSRIASDISGRMRHCWSGRGRNNGDGFSRVNGDGYCDEGARMDADAPERARKEHQDE